MRRWEATIGEKSVNEDEINWEFVKDKVDSLSLNIDGRKISLPKGMEYLQGKTASAFIGSGKVNIESRYIGFELEGIRVLIRVDERTGDIKLETKSVKVPS